MHLGVPTPSVSLRRAAQAICGVATFALLAPVPPVWAASESEPAARPSPAPRIEFPVSTHDFGSVPKGPSVRYDFKVLNTGSAPLEISAVQPACGCTTAGEWTRRIEAGGSGTIPIQFATAGFTGPVTKTVTITSNDPTRHLAVLEITASIWTPIQISNPVVIFPALTELDQVVTRTATIRNQVAGTVTLTDLKIDNPVFRPELKETVPGREYELTITTVPPLATGTQTAHVTMKTSNPDMPELTVQAVVTVLPPIQVAPTEIVLTATKLTTAEKKYVVVLNHRGGDLQLSDLKTNVDGVEISTNAAANGKQFTIALTFPAGFAARPAGKMFFSGKTNRPDLPSFEVPIVVAGNR